MPGFATYDAIINALSTGKGQRPAFHKTALTTVVGSAYDLWVAGGLPAAGVWGTALTGRVIDSTFTGAMAYSNPTGPATEHLLSIGAGSTVSLGTMMLYDRLVEYPFAGTSTANSFNAGAGIAPPARDANGAALGDGVHWFMERFNNTAAPAAATATITYTNSAGTAGKTSAVLMNAGTALPGFITNPTGFQAALATGDSGIRSIQSMALSVSMVTTQMNVVLYRPLAYLPIMAANSYVERDLVLQSANLPRLFDGSALGLAVLSNATTSPVFGGLQSAEN